MHTSDTDSAMREWASAVGEENVSTHAAELRAAERGTFPTGHRIPACLASISQEPFDVPRKPGQVSQDLRWYSQPGKRASHKE